MITRGKWYVIGHAPAVFSKVEDNDGEAIAVADCRSVDVDEATARDNAQLIAAAKELLDACIEVENCGKRLPSVKVRCQVRAAIRKALAGETE